MLLKRDMSHGWVTGSQRVDVSWERQVGHGGSGCARHKDRSAGGRDVCVTDYHRRLELEPRAVIPLTQSSLPTNLTTFMRPLVINSRQPGRTDQENRWREATVHTALVISTVGTCWGSSGRGWGKEAGMSCQRPAVGLPSSSALAEHGPPPHLSPA